ncbi:unnamed protein product [Lymnaea stagnalis]|uniref:Cilia- and flagella-associated protein 46 n=1 Tax=Lymnaea stagnalis TaxID=6523 RepID=A0AAV2HYK1_LYMST
MELARLCLELNLADLAKVCCDRMEQLSVKDPSFQLEKEFLECEMMVKALGNKQETFQKAVVDIRLQAIKKCEEAIMNAMRLGDPNVIQAGCVTQWNLCLPLLQPNLRHKVRRPLAIIAQALENIDSLLVLLRCQVHTELSQCEEDQEQIEAATENLKKALYFDDTGVYHEKLEASLHRLELRAQLYKQPETSEDQAAMIIEQARTSDSGTIRMKRSLLVKAGEALAPDNFLLVLDSENEAKEVSAVKESLTQVKQLAGKAKQHKLFLQKTEGYLSRLGEDNAKEIAKLWADLAKTARKQEVWDVCRVACRFCLLFDDPKWQIVAPPVTSKAVSVAESVSVKQDHSASDTLVEETSSKPEIKTASRMTVGPSTPQPKLNNKDLMRMIAEISFVNGEALIQLLRSHGLQLNDLPVYPEDKSKRPKGYVPKKPEEDTDWIEYCDWLKNLSKEATQNFLRGLTLGVVLNEPWIVCSAAAYIWNYNNHIISQGREAEITSDLTTVLEGLKRVGHAGETEMLVNLCNGLANGLVKPWIPKSPPETAKPEPAVEAPPMKSSKGGKTPAVTAPKNPPNKLSFGMPPEALSDLKKAVEVCEHAMRVTNGTESQNIVPMYVRMPLLQAWVRAKQIAQQAISKSYGTEDEHSRQGQNSMTRAVVAVEILSLNKSGQLEFKDVPTLEDVVNMVLEAKWTEKLVELQLWTRLTFLAHEAHNAKLVTLCCKNASKLESRLQKLSSHQQLILNEMLSYANLILGQSLIENMKGRNSIRREAIEAFVISARYARKAGNYDLVMTAARHFWNASVPLVGLPMERELLKEHLKTVLEAISATASMKFKKDKSAGSGQGDKTDGAEKEPEGVKDDQKEPEKTTGPAPTDDLSLRAAMYGVLFQSFADKGEWPQALESIDQAVACMPRTKHRLILFKHRVMVKAKLGQNINMDMQKFKDESDDFIANMWRRVALSSKKVSEQLISYQNAIDVLETAGNEYQKVEYLLEFGQWLYSNQFPTADAQDQVEWAVDILLSIKQSEEAKASLQPDGKKRKGSRLRETKSFTPKVMEKPITPASVKMVSVIVTPSGRMTADKTSSKRDVKSHTPVMLSEAASREKVGGEELVPSAKQIEIGSPVPENPVLSVKEISEVRQLDALFRSHMLLAEFCGPDCVQYTDILLMAYSYLMRLWEVLIQAFGQSMKDLSKKAPTVVKDELHSQSGTKTKKEDKKKEEKEKAAQQLKRKRKLPLDVLPADLETWALYDWPEEGFEAFKIDKLKSVAINEDNIPKPMLTFHYTDSLIKQLKSIGYTPMTFPVLAFQDLLSRSVVPSSALNKLVHLWSMEICQELDLRSGIIFHQKIVGNPHISEADQALSRNQIARWKDIQLQVAKEEQRLKEAKEAMVKQTNSRPKAQQSRLSPKIPETVKASEPSIGTHLGKVLGAVSLRDVWTDTADVLIRQGNYQRAREYLNEANIAAEAFTDQPLKAKILLLLAKLAYREAQYGRAIMLCTQAQELKEGEEEFWYDSLTLLVKATLKEKWDNSNAHKAKKILAQAIREFNRFGDSFVNRSKKIKYYCTKLETRLIHIYFDHLKHKFQKNKTAQFLELVLACCERYESLSENMISLGYWRSARKLSQERAQFLRYLSEESDDSELVKIYYMQIVSVLKEASSLAEKIFMDVHSLIPMAQLKNMNTPVQRELADVKLEMAGILTDILTLHHKELRHKQLQEEKKPPIILLIEEFVKEAPVHDSQEKEWLDFCRIAGDDAVSVLLSAQSLCNTIPWLKAKCLVGLGRLLLVMADLQGPDPPMQWMVNDIETMRQQLAAEVTEAAVTVQASASFVQPAPDDEEVIAVNENLPPEAGKPTSPPVAGLIKDRAKLVALINDKKKQLDSSKYYYMCASEFLYHGLNFCLQNQLTDTAATASLELVKLFGQFDAGAASMMLALHQSCRASMTLEKLLFKSQPDPSTSKLAAMLHQKQQILKHDLTTNMSSSSLYKELKMSLLTDWQAGKKLEVSTGHVDLLKDFPSNFNLIVLQHSPDKKFLYGAIMDKPKGAQGPVKTKDKNYSRARIFGEPIDNNKLQEILAEIEAYKQQQQSMLLRREYQRSQAVQREKMLENLNENQKTPIKAPVNYDFEESELENMFKKIIAAMNAYLQPLLGPICHSIKSPNIINASSNDPANKPSKDSVPQNELVIFLVDTDLMHLPLEACDPLKTLEGVISVSRDFSLQLLRRRSQDDKKVEEKDAKKSGKDASDGTSRIPGLRDAKMKQAKIVPLNRQVQPWQAEVSTNNFRYIVDPYLECSEAEEKKPIGVFNKILQTYETQFTSRWLGVLGSDHTPSIGEWEIYISESSAFIFYGMERVLSYIPPHKMATLNSPGCNILFSFDLAETAKSFQRQSKLDVYKTPYSLSFESPVETAMLASVTGIKCIIMNQWHTTLAENATKLESAMEYLLKKGLTTGQALYLLQNPVKAYMDAKQDEALSSSPKSARGAKAAVTKSDTKSPLPQDAGAEARRDSVDENIPAVTRSAFNTVCYGMPNLIVTQ